MTSHPSIDHTPSAASLPTSAGAHDSDFTAAHPLASTPDPTTASTANAAQGGFSAAAASAAAELPALQMRLRQALRQFPDFPSPGILFEDILPIFADPGLHDALLRALELHVIQQYGEAGKPDVVVGLEARGFLFGPSLALRLGAGFVPVRKKGKLPGPTETATYKKEYGEDFFEMQKDAIRPGQRVLIVDDIIATGGSAAAAGSLVKGLEGDLLGYLFILELDFLKGRDKLEVPSHTLLSSQEK